MEQQLLKDFESYEEVRNNGNYNMMDARAIEESGLDKDRYFYIIKNYNEIQEKYEENQ